MRRVAILIETSLGSGRDMLVGIGDHLRQQGIEWNLFSQPGNAWKTVPSWFENWHGDGVIARIYTPEVAQAIASKSVPVVDVLGAFKGQLPFPIVHVDNQAIGKMAAKHLQELSFRHFGFCGPTNENWSSERAAAFQREVEAAGGTFSAFGITTRMLEDTAWETIVDSAAEWISRIPKPLAIFLAYDGVALPVREACRKLGLKVGEEVALLGVDNDRPLCKIMHPELSSIDAAHFEVGWRAAETLHYLMENRMTVIPPRLVPPKRVVVRASTNFVASQDPVVAKAVAFIRNRAHHGINVDDVLKQVNVSRSVLQRRVKTVLGKTVHDEIIDSRLRLAMALIQDTSLPLETIAIRSGFKYLQSMNKAFQARFSKPPSYFRTENSGVKDVYRYATK